MLQLSEQLATIKMTQAISMSGEAMAAMNQLINVPVLSASMRTLGMEMEKAGFIQEMMTDTLQQDDVEAEADEEIDKGLCVCFFLLRPHHHLQCCFPPPSFR